MGLHDRYPKRQGRTIERTPRSPAIWASPAAHLMAVILPIQEVWIRFGACLLQIFQAPTRSAHRMAGSAATASWPASGTDFLFQVITQDDYKNVIYRMNGHPSAGNYTKIDRVLTRLCRLMVPG